MIRIILEMVDLKPHSFAFERAGFVLWERIDKLFSSCYNVFGIVCPYVKRAISSIEIVGGTSLD